MQDPEISTPASSVETPPHVIAAFSRLCTLNFQQRQMLKDGETLALLEQLVADRHSADWIFLCATFGFAANFAFGLLVGDLNWISGLVAIVSWLSYSKQKQTTAEVTRIVRDFADSQGYKVPTQESQLLTELRLHHCLLYQQKQQLKAGEVTAVAAQIVTQIRRSGWTQLATMTFAGIFQLIQILSRQGNLLSGSKSTLLITMLNVGVLIGFGFWTARTHFLKARKLEELMGLHPTEMAALETGVESSTDPNSPYRTPQFR